MVILWAHMVVTTIWGEFREIEQSLPILGLLIHEQITVHDIVPHFTYFVLAVYLPTNHSLSTAPYQRFRLTQL